MPIIQQPSVREFENEHISEHAEDGAWGPMQIAAPAIIGGVLLVFFAAYIIWQRKDLLKRSYDYHAMRSNWASKLPRMFIPRRMRHRVHHSSDPITLDDSIPSELDFRRIRQHRSDSADSQTPLTSTSYTFDYPPVNTLSESPPPIAKRHSVRWWWLFGSRPRKVRSKEPGSQWRVDGPDGSHEHGSHEHEGFHSPHAALAGVPEDPREEDEGSVIQIGGDFVSIASTPMTHHFPEQVRAVRGLPSVPEQSPSSGTLTPLPAVTAPQSGRGTPVSSANRGPPPSYGDSQSYGRYRSEEDIVRFDSPRPYMALPPPVRTAGYQSPQASHRRELSSDSFLTTQPPMVATSIY